MLQHDKCFWTFSIQSISWTNKALFQSTGLIHFHKMLLVILGISIYVTSTLSHSHLAQPLPTRRLDCRVGNKREERCYGPCPPLSTYGQPTGIGPKRTAATWRRGERQTIKWHRNNHGNGESGFVRLSLVPFSKMFDKDAHQRYTTHITCWSSGLHRCYSRNEHVCGNDAEGMGYQVDITVPTSYPDGVYVFGWAWYGGGDYRERSYFGDYYSCSFIQIRGGDQLTATWTPKFIPAPNGEFDDECLSATDRLGVCAEEPCNIGPVRPLKPVGLPQNIYASEFDATGLEVGPEDEKVETSSDSLEGNEGDGNDLRILGMQVIDVRTQSMINVEGFELTVRPNAYKDGFTLGLRTEGKVVSVRFDTSSFSHTEYQEPYIINGNDNEFHAFNICEGRNTATIRCVVSGISVTKEVQYKLVCIE